MNREDAEKIIEKKQLRFYSFFEDRPDVPYELVIKETGGKWSVYATNGMAEKILHGEAVFETEEEALESFISRLLIFNKIMMADSRDYTLQ